MIKIKHRGNFKRTESFFDRALGKSYEKVLDKYGQAGVDALAAATPKDTGKTAASWSYQIIESSKGPSIVWNNSNIQNGLNIAVILQYGHGTGNGGYVTGIDYINPALASIFDDIANEAWKEVTRK